MRRTTLLLPLVAVLAALDCGGRGPTHGSGLARVPLGPWGGDHVFVSVALDQVRVEFDCAHGSVEAPLRLDPDGAFRANGVFVRERGGPVGDVPPDTHPAVYSGATDGRVMTFYLTLTDSHETLGPFTAIYRAMPRLMRCLMAGPMSSAAPR